MSNIGGPMTVTRVGHGYDLHRLVEGCRLVLGGVPIESDFGLQGHSDADVVLHAIIDALLGAAGAGDIGEHFPDTDGRHRKADSAALMAQASDVIEQAGYRPYNVDVTIIAESPRLGGYKNKMRRRIAQILGLESDQVNVKAKTNEGLGDIGAGRAIACHAVATVSKDLKLADT